MANEHICEPDDITTEKCSDRATKCDTVARIMTDTDQNTGQNTAIGLESVARKPEANLRRGWTTGACATGAACAAYQGLITGQFPETISIRLPRGQQPVFELKRSEILENRRAVASIIKDAGDDPDVTHGAEIVATVQRGEPDTGITFFAGEGVGTVMLPGLPLSVGEPAINPKPREMMADNLTALIAELGGFSDIAITVSIPGGETLAEKTMNGRLGIAGGLSVLGTTGVVIPFSCASWIHSIHRGVDVARAGNQNHIVASTGSTSEAAARTLFDVPETALIDMGDFVGGLLKYLRENPLPRLTIAGGFGKITKLSQGALDLHSSRSRVDMKKLARVARLSGCTQQTAHAIRGANTALEALTLADKQGINLAVPVALQAREVARATVIGNMEIDVLIVDRQGKMIGNTRDR